MCKLFGCVLTLVLLAVAATPAQAQYAQQSSFQFSASSGGGTMDPADPCGAGAFLVPQLVPAFTPRVFGFRTFVGFGGYGGFNQFAFNRIGGFNQFNGFNHFGGFGFGGPRVAVNVGNRFGFHRVAVNAGPRRVKVRAR